MTPLIYGRAARESAVPDEGLRISGSWAAWLYPPSNPHVRRTLRPRQLKPLGFRSPVKAAGSQDRSRNCPAGNVTP